MTAIESAGGNALVFQAAAANPASQRAGVEQAAAVLGGIDILVDNPADGEFAGQMVQAIPLGRYSKVEEVAGAVAFLAGPDASYITGTTLTIDGGATA